MTFKNGVHEGVRSVVVDNFGGGSIVIEPGPRPDLVESSINAADERFLSDTQVSHEGEYLRITFPSRLIRNATAHLRLGVPDGLSFVIKAGSATVSVSAPVGRSKIACGAGDITIGRALDLDCSTGSGDISVSSLGGTASRLTTGSGDVTIGDLSCPTSAKSGSGDLVVRSVRGADLQASSGSGDISVAETTSSVDLRSASGSVTVGVADGLPAWLDLTSLSGSIRIALESTSQPAPGEPYVAVSARTGSGDIAVYRA